MDIIDEIRQYKDKAAKWDNHNERLAEINVLLDDIELKFNDIKLIINPTVKISVRNNKKHSQCDVMLDDLYNKAKSGSTITSDLLEAAGIEKNQRYYLLSKLATLPNMESYKVGNKINVHFKDA